jgi:hypothetical protein
MADDFGDIVFDEDEKHPATLEELIEGWLAYQAAPNKAVEDEYWWACSAVFKLTAHYPEWAWRFILATLDSLVRNPNDDAFAVLAAGALEDLLAIHGSIVIDRVETEARQSPDFRRLLGGVWQNRMSDDSWQRVTKAAVKRW